MSQAAKIQALVDAVALLATSINDRFSSINVDGGDAATLGGKTLATIESEYGTAAASAADAVALTLSTFIGRRDNPHEVTAAQVGLGSLQNLPMATQVIAEAGTSELHYMSPLRAKQHWDARWAEKVGSAPSVLDTIEEIAAALQGNPDVIQDILDAIGGKLGTGDKAADSSLFDGMTPAQFTASVLTGTAANATLLAGQSIADLTANNAETAAGILTTKWVTPAGLKHVLDPIRTDVQTNTDDIDALLTQLATAFEDAADVVAGTP